MFSIGVISCVHGHDGAVVLRTYVDVKELPEFVFIDMISTFVPFKVEKVTSKGNNFIINFDDVNDRAEAAEIIKHKVFISDESAGEFVEMKEGVKIKGFKIIDKNLGEIGVVEDVEEYPAQDCIVVKKEGLEKTFLIPYVDAIVLHVDYEKKIVETDVPVGLV